MSQFFRVVCITLFLGTMGCAIEDGSEVGGPFGAGDESGEGADGFPADLAATADLGLVDVAEATSGSALAAPKFVDACLLPGRVKVTFQPTGTYDAGDEGVTAALPLPFPFTLYGKSHRQFWLTTNGQLGFGSTVGGSDFGQVTCPLADSRFTTPIVFVYSTDLVRRLEGGGDVCFATWGMAPRRRLIVTWKDFFHYDAWLTSHFTFSATLHEASNVIDVALDRAEAPTVPEIEQGLTAVIGHQGGSTAQSYSCHQPLASAGTTVRFSL